MPQNPHVESFLEMLAVERGAAVTTCESYRWSLGCFAKFLSERGREIHEGQADDLRAFLAELTEAGLARSTIARHLKRKADRAAMRADAMLEKSDLDGYAVWKGKPAHNMYIAAISSHLESG